MERESFDITDYDPDENVFGSISTETVPHSRQTSGPSSPIYQTPTINNSEEVEEEYVITVVVNRQEEDKADLVSDVRREVEERRKRIASVSEELKRLKSLSTAKKNPTRDRSKSTAAKPLNGLKTFIEPAEGGWITVERRFDKAAADTDGMLIRSKLGECVGIKSKEFAMELFDTLARRGYLGESVNAIDKDQLREWWDLINDQNFDSWLMLFFDMVDKDSDGRITQEEIREFINLLASANNMSTINEKADEYAALIMEEFDSHGFGYIYMDGFKMLLMQLETECVIRTRTAKEETTMMLQRNPFKSWYKLLKKSHLPR